MAIFIDTSVWIEYFRGTPQIISRVHHQLDEGLVILPAPVKIELLAGVQKKELPRLQRILSALEERTPGDAEWQRIEDWLPKIKESGWNFSLVDLLIASIVASEDSTDGLWSLDNDFKRLANLGLVRLIESS